MLYTPCNLYVRLMYICSMYANILYVLKYLFDSVYEWSACLWILLSHLSSPLPSLSLSLYQAGLKRLGRKEETSRIAMASFSRLIC